MVDKRTLETYSMLEQPTGVVFIYFQSYPELQKGIALSIDPGQISQLFTSYRAELYLQRVNEVFQHIITFLIFRKFTEYADMVLVI